MAQNLSSAAVMIGALRVKQTFMYVRLFGSSLVRKVLNKYAQRYCEKDVNSSILNYDFFTQSFAHLFVIL